MVGLLSRRRAQPKLQPWIKARPASVALSVSSSPRLLSTVWKGDPRMESRQMSTMLGEKGRGVITNRHSLQSKPGKGGVRDSEQM